MNGWMDLFTGAGVVTAIGIVRWPTLFNTRVYLWPGTTAVFDISCPKIPDLKALGPVNWCPFLSCMRWRAARRVVRAGALLLVSSFPPIQFCVDSLCTHSYPRQSDHPGHPSTTGQSRTRASRAPGKHALPGFPHRRPYLRSRLGSAPVEQRA